jgi:Fe-S-cluster containining protein
VLRVDELGKRAGVDCVHQRGQAGCAIHAERPSICRAYECLWLQGGLEDDERPDRTGGIVDLETTGIGLRLGIREVRPGAFDESPALQSIAARYREQMPVRITDAEDILNPDRPFRVLLADGVEQRLSGDRIEVFQNDVLVERRRLPWAERLGRRLSIAIRRLSLGGDSRGASER